MLACSAAATRRSTLAHGHHWSHPICNDKGSPVLVHPRPCDIFAATGTQRTSVYPRLLTDSTGVRHVAQLLSCLSWKHFLKHARQ